MSEFNQDEGTMPAELEPVQSPCKSLCKLNSDRVCEGCFRTSSEISFWVSMDDAQKLEVIAAAHQRQLSRSGLT